MSLSPVNTTGYELGLSALQVSPFCSPYLGFRMFMFCVKKALKLHTSLVQNRETNFLSEICNYE